MRSDLCEVVSSTKHTSKLTVENEPREECGVNDRPTVSDNQTRANMLAFSNQREAVAVGDLVIVWIPASDKLKSSFFFL